MEIGNATSLQRKKHTNKHVNDWKVGMFSGKDALIWSLFPEENNSCCSS